LWLPASYYFSDYNMIGASGPTGLNEFCISLFCIDMIDYVPNAASGPRHAFYLSLQKRCLHLKGKNLTVQANIKWTDGLQFVAQPDNQPAMVIDSPENGSGAGPMAMLLMGVAGCTAIDVITILQKKRLNISRFEVNISGERAQEYPRRFTRIDIEYVVHGQSISTQAMEQAIKLSETKYCGAMASMNAEFSHSYRIVPT